jgi:Domain of unknown function (DU1801)
MVQSRAQTPTGYIASLEEPRRREIRMLHRLIRRVAPGLKPVVLHGMLGYGPFHYRYASGREGDTTTLALASQKRYISLYVTCSDPSGAYLAESYRDQLPKADIGKSCIRFKRLDDVDLDVITELVTRAAELGGTSATA